MTREDHQAPLRGGIAASGAIIYSADRDEHALRAQEREMRARFPLVRLHLVRADFNQPLALADLDGIVMANSLRFQSDACASLAHAGQWLKVGERLIVVEYDVQKASPWVPHPVPWARLPDIAACAGLSGTRLIDVRPSRYHGRGYPAVGVKTA